MDGAEDKQAATANQPTTTPTSSLPSHDVQRDTVKAASAKNKHTTVHQPLSALQTSSLSPHDGRREAIKVAAGAEEYAAIRIFQVTLPTSDPTSPLSPPGGQQDVGQSTTAVAATTAATATTAAPTSPLDQVLICGHGRFQAIVLVCTTLAFFTTIVHALASANLARPVDHWCRPPATYSYMTPEAWRNVGIPVVRDQDGGESRSQCLRFEPPLPDPESSGETPDNRTAVPCDAGWQYESGASSGKPCHGIFFGDSHVHSIVDEWDLVCGRGWIVSALAAAYMAGGVVGAPIAGVAADRIGRQPVLCIWLVLLVFAGTTLAFAQNVSLFSTLRFLLSAGAAGVLVASHVMLFEVTDTEHRAPYCAIAVAGATFFAAVYSELVHVFVSNWHDAQSVSPQLAYMVPTCGLVAAVYLVEESPCWLLALCELRYAENVLARAAYINAIEPQQFRRRLSALKGEVKRQHDHLGTQQEPEGGHAIVSDHEVRLSDLLSYQPLRQRSAIIFGCWFLVFGTFSHLSTSHVMRTNEAARSTLVLLRMPCVVADVYVLKHVGRRLSLAASMLALSLAMGALSVAHVFDQLAAVLVVSGLVVFDLSAITVFALSAELYPTVIRGAALGCCYMSGRLGALVAPFVNEIPSPLLKSVAYAVSAAMLLLLGTMAFELPETRHLPPSNTVQGMMAVEDKWQLYSPLRVARSGSKRRRSKATLTESHQMRRRSSLPRQQGVLRVKPAASS
ncbi:solute carrier family 22 member 7-like [Dermacentor andersoni]|uniref:solute carrier family 22 member 7-like n=1 Tax=Dermacentor andersoni TaxID=34620 RepID=UPI003B3A6FB4